MSTKWWNYNFRNLTLLVLITYLAVNLYNIDPQGNLPESCDESGQCHVSKLSRKAKYP